MTPGQGHCDLRVERPATAVAVVTLDRPQARNALSLSLIHQLHVVVRTLGADPAVSVIVLAAEGPVFSSGHDLKELNAHRDDADGGRRFYETTMKSCAAMMQSIVSCPRPVVAAVNGVATAAGCQLVATCDLAVAAETARFATPGVNIGLFCSTPMVALSRNVPRKHAMEMLLLGEMLTAQDAARFGLVNRVVAPEQALDEALSMAKLIASKPRSTVTIGKEAFYHQLEQPLAEAYAYAADVMTRNMMDADAEEGICAFLDKRPPEWTA